MSEDDYQPTWVFAERKGIPIRVVSDRLRAANRKKPGSVRSTGTGVKLWHVKDAMRALEPSRSSTRRRADRR